MAHWFPPANIKDSKTCLLKWSQVSLYLWENTSSSCHRNLNALVPADYDFNNTEPVVKHREKMLNGDWPSDGRGCEHCRDQEAAGGISDRIQFLNNPSMERYVPIELIKNPTETKVKPTQISVHFNNKCNLKCVYCGPNQSSSWVKEQWKYDDGKSYDFDPWEQDKTYKQRLSNFYKWMEENYSNLKAFDILGGEPLIQPETFDCIDWMIAHPNKEVYFELYTNMQIKPELFKRGMKKLRELAGSVREVLIVGSIDCFGPESEFIRFGHDWETFEENWLYMLHECPEIVPTMNWTVSALSIPYIPKLIEKVIEWNKIRGPHAVNYNKVIDPFYLNPSIMPAGTYTESIKEILQLNEIMYGDAPYKEYAKSIFNEIEKAPHEPKAVKELKQNLDKLDARRGTNWQKTFPWLVNL
jgi:hypothetical protein